MTNNYCHQSKRLAKTRLLACCAIDDNSSQERQKSYQAKVEEKRTMRHLYVQPMNRQLGEGVLAIREVLCFEKKAWICSNRLLDKVYKTLAYFSRVTFSFSVLFVLVIRSITFTSTRKRGSNKVHNHSWLFHLLRIPHSLFSCARAYPSVALDHIYTKTQPLLALFSTFHYLSIDTALLSFLHIFAFFLFMLFQRPAPNNAYPEYPPCRQR